MLDKTITSALITLRAQILRGHLDGLDHVDALLALRGVDLFALQVRAKRKPDCARQGIMRLMVIEALKGGPKRHAEISTLVVAKRPEIEPNAAHKRTGQALDRMRQAGLVKREGRLWGLAQ